MADADEVASIGARVQAYREHRGWKRSELARRSGVSEVYIGQLEEGTRDRPGVTVVLALARALEVPSMDDLVGYVRPGENGRATDERLAQVEAGLAELRRLLDSQ